ncbi:sugar transferase [Pseudoalteromonas sp. DY56-GL79]|uniref:sugar transferase n=1 Tax=Pseudoalteromonas sp. DY56-GL79 TaxID=2967131 RepID=UPI003529E25B
MKRLFDICITSLVLLALLPLLVIVAILIKATSHGPIFFLQARLGKHGQVFNIYKFRTMTDAKRDFNVQVTQGNSEVTMVGNVIRRLKIDELPQLFNVLKGDMSIVGPRPCLPALQSEFNEDGKKRLLVRPGLTGLAQVNGNIHLTWEQRWAFDSQYVSNQTLYLDVKIILRTVMVVLFGDSWGKKL